MNMLRIVLIVIFGLALCAALQLPDPVQNTPEAVFADLPPLDWGSMATAQWKADQAGAAILLLDYVIESEFPNAAVACGLRDEYLTTLHDNSTPAGQVKYFGHPVGEAPDDNYSGLAGLSVADYFVYGNLRGAFDETPKVNQADQFLSLLNGAGTASTSLFPPAEPALALLKAAKIQGALRASLVQQMTDVLTFIQTAANTPLALTAIQESVMPVYQLAKKCNTWTEFEGLIKGAGSVDQIKVLTRMASAAPSNAKKMAQILAVAGPDLSARCIGFATRNGQKGLDALHVGVRKGPAGLQFVLAHPGVSAQILANARVMTIFKDTPILTWWQAQQARYGWIATLVKYAGITVLCVGLCLSVMPQRIFRLPFHATGQLSEEAQRRVNIYYWVGVFTVSLSICLLLLLRSVSLPAGPAENPGFTIGAGSAPVGHSGIAAEDSTRTPPLLILMSVILIVQGTCWWAARRKIQEVENDTEAAAAEKLKRLENLDIFFDLPLYCGLALTICAFILITTFGAGVSRFLAYSATFVGIVCSVILRIGFLYPLREKLITRKES
jgi:hypothetical protein